MWLRTVFVPVLIPRGSVIVASGLAKCEHVYLVEVTR